MSVDTKHFYVISDKKILSGEPVIRSTRTPVRAIVELWRMGLSPEEIKTKLPHLTLAQIFDALSYFKDHSEEINGYIEKNTVPETLL
ncbi:MAG: DUF433 domain-containing protein [Candidatus Cloacimonadota bacterium]|nr:MAG: DUF433 domain-containing protein [Candidatus Cloacimonadota bacterium]